MQIKPIRQICRVLDTILLYAARLGSLAMVVLLVIAVYDVLTRYFGVGRIPGVNATMSQEAQAWAHTMLFAFVMAYGYTVQTHVRIDLITANLPYKVRYCLEIFGNLVLLAPFAAVAGLYGYYYARRSFISGEISASTTGLTNLWIPKAMLVVMFVLILIAGLSQLLKSIEGLLGGHTEEDAAKVLGAGHIQEEVQQVTVGGQQ